MDWIFVISLLLLNVLCCESLSLINGECTFTENIRLTNHLLENKTNIGIGMCIRDCRTLSGCQSVNYNKFTFLCELNAAHTNVDSLDDTTFYKQDGTYFVDLKSVTPLAESCFKYGSDASSLCPAQQILVTLHNNEEKCVTKDRVICSKGFFFNGKECESCPAGSFQALEGMPWCDLCPPGMFQNKIGQVRCISCESGSYQNNTGSAACKPCPSDGYFDYCNKNGGDLDSSSKYFWSYTCNRSTIEYYYSYYSYSIFRSAENRTYCMLFPAIRDTVFRYFSSIYSTIRSTSVYTSTTTLNNVRNACVDKCVRNREPCDAVMHNYKNSSYHSHSCSLLQLTEVETK